MYVYMYLADTFIQTTYIPFQFAPSLKNKMINLSSFGC